jgi:DNA-binding SARP family transcriptional activator
MAEYRGQLLPGRTFDDWAAEARERLTRLQLDLIDRLAEIATEDGDVDEAIRMRRAGITLDPDDDARYVALADLLARQGRRGPARAALDAGVAALRALGLPPTAEMEALRTAIGRASDARRPASGP